MITLCNFLGWSLSVLSCWDSFWLLCIKQLSSKDTRVINILRMLVVWWATSTTNCQICIPCSQMSHPSESFSSPLSPTGHQVTAVLGHQILLWETAFYYDMADDWSKNSYEFDSIGHPIAFPNIHPDGDRYKPNSGRRHKKPPNSNYGGLSNYAHA